MNSLNKLHAEQDEFIKKVFQEDKIVSQPILDNFTSYIENSNIKVKKYSYKQRKIILLLLILLIISVGYNIYLLVFKDNNDSSNIQSTNISNNNSTLIENTYNQNNTNVANITNSTNSVEKNNTTIATNVTLIEKEKMTYSEINVYELEDFIEEYSFGIQRISYNTETLESNTILLFIAKKYFDKNSNKSSLSIDTTYASSTENIHTFLTELTGKDYSNIDHISSYNNYIGYTSSSNSYIYGKDYKIIAKEVYDCSEVAITNEEDGVYTATAKVTRTIDDEETNYEISFTFKINEDYKYQKYNILSLKAKNTSFSVDNTIHLVDSSEEDDEN